LKRDSGQPGFILKEASAMDRLRLRECLEAAGVPEDRYLLVGLDPPRAVREGACIVRPNQRRWEVLVWEPARMVAALSFLNEDQACDYALDVLTAAAGRRPLEALDAVPADTEAAELAPASAGTVANWAAAIAGHRKAPLHL
jgi:hypothetical protein